MKRLVLESVLLLLWLEVVMQLGGLKALHRILRSQTPNEPVSNHRMIPEFSHAVDLACVFYFKPVLCLQRSSVLAILLRRRGIAAELVIGAQLLPFRSHAWVELSGAVINDKPYVGEIYMPMERC